MSVCLTALLPDRVRAAGSHTACLFYKVVGRVAIHLVGMLARGALIVLLVEWPRNRYCLLTVWLSVCLSGRLRSRVRTTGARAARLFHRLVDRVALHIVGVLATPASCSWWSGLAERALRAR